MNKLSRPAVFMNEGRQLVAGEAILGETATLVRSERSQSEDEVLEGLVRQHARLVYRIAYAVLRRHHDAEDATQETFIRVLRYGHRLAQVEDHKTWLARIAWHVAVGQSNQSRRKKETPLDDSAAPRQELASADLSADDAVHGSQVGAQLERLIAALPEKLRQPLILSTVEEISPQEVAETLGISEAAVRSRVFRARQILRDKLAAQAGRK
jgi:RNA polymerase sigma-70 factor, ECF subfamily